jgi:hypothetical protein
MALSSEWIAAAPQQWVKSAIRPDSPTVSVQGLLADERNEMEVAGLVPATDCAKVFEIDGPSAQAFGLVIRDILQIEGVTYMVDDLIAQDFGTVVAILRRVI